jgi:uncharacterized protein YlaN (UPF0358 family)
MNIQKGIAAAWILGASLLLTAPAEAAQPKDQPNKNVELTEEQLNELSNLHKEVLEKNKQIIQKQIEYGLMKEEKGKVIMSMMEKRFKELEENGFAYKHSRHHHRIHDDR